MDLVVDHTECLDPDAREPPTAAERALPVSHMATATIRHRLSERSASLRLVDASLKQAHLGDAGRRYLDLVDEVLDDYPEDANDGVGTSV
jgi:hypothetical protein